MEHGTIIDRLEDEIRRYRAEFQRFFNGEAQIPPEEQGRRIRKRLTSLAGDPELSAVDRFRLSGLESRYNSLEELFRRRQREMDTAQRPGAVTEPDASPAVVVDVGASGSEEQLERLYDAIYGREGSRIARRDFRAYLAGHAAKVRQRTGCDKVRFTVREESGRAKLKARPLRDARTD